MPLLSVRDLHTHFVTRGLDNRLRIAKALNGVDLDIEPGETFGLVGETGAGKSLTAMSVMGLLRAPARVVRGQAWFQGEDLLALSAAELNRRRGADLSIVVQSPKSSLDPTCRIGDQLVRAARAHDRVPSAAASRRALEMLEAVGIPDPDRRARAWPHELSGGMAQRVLIALALINQPRLLIADEPTTGLDVTVQAQVLQLLHGLSRASGMATLIISHDLGVIAHFCERMAVMFAGRVVETGTVREIFASPRHPYTRVLMAASPDRLARGARVPPIGEPPDLYRLPEGCAYAYRCVEAAPACAAPVPVVGLGGSHAAACHRVREVVEA